MTNFLRFICLSENLYARRRSVISRRKLRHCFATIILLSILSSSNAQHFFPNFSPAYNLIAANFHQENNIHFHSIDFPGHADSLKTFAPVTSIASGNWTNGAIWSGGQAPGSSDDVVITSGFTVTVDANSASNNLTIDNG